MKKRLLWLDMARGMAILIVVLSHSLLQCVQEQQGQIDDSELLRIICSFQMPLFMFISGVATYLSLVGNESAMNGIEFIKKRIKLLLVPFVAWIFVPYFFISHSFPLQEVFLRLKTVAKSPDYALWFLYVLFVIDCFFFIMWHVNKKTRIPFVILTVFIYYALFFLIKIFHFNYFGVALIKTHIRYFMAGYIIYKLHENCLCRYKKIEYIILFFLSACFILTARFWYWSGKPAFMDFDSIKASGYIVSNCLCKIYEWLLPYCGISMVIILALVFSKIRFLSSFRIVGTYTLEIYAMHLYGFTFIDFFGYTAVGIVMDTFMGIAFSMLVAYLLKGSVLSRILFGKNINNTRKLVVLNDEK